jgi:hypothetical protein
MKQSDEAWTCCLCLFLLWGGLLLRRRDVIAGLQYKQYGHKLRRLRCESIG